MKKNFTITFLIIIIIVSFYLFYKDWKIYTETNKINVESLLSEGLIVFNSLETKVVKIDDAYVKFDIKYPYFVNIDKEFNKEIENSINEKIEDHKTISKENWLSRYNTQMSGENIPMIPAKEEDKYSFFADFTIVQSNSNYISFILKYGGFSGGAHGYEEDISYNYDVKNKKIITLKDLFPNDPEYLIRLSTKSREYLKEQFATVSEEDKKNSSPEDLKEHVDNIISMIDSGTEPKEENFSIFTFTPDKVKIYFTQYQVGPYVIGMPEFETNIK